MIEQIDINADVGESYGRFKVGNDTQLIPMLTSCNIACGFHGGDPLTIKKTIDLAMENGVRMGAHPSYPDLQGFGRRSMKIGSDELRAILVYQIGALKVMVESQGGQLTHVKPHGALNNDMMKAPDLLQLIVEAVEAVDPGLLIYVPYGHGDRINDNCIWEIFADRTYESDLSLTPRSTAGSLITVQSEAEKHLQSILKDRQVRTPEGFVTIDPETICIHGDNPLATEIVGIIRHLSESQGFTIQSIR